MTATVPGAGIVDFRLLFESVPGLFLVLLPDPEFTIAAASDAYLQATMTRRTQVVGRPLFEVFPDNPGDPGADGVRKLRASLMRVVSTGVADAMAMQKYDVQNADGSGYVERYWSPSNFPVTDSNGVLCYIMHRAEDITAYVQLRKMLNNPDLPPSASLPESKPVTSPAELELPALERNVIASHHHLAALNRTLKLEILARNSLEESNRALTQELKRNIEKLEESNKELESFSYSVSHDLRAPLRAVDGFARMLEEDVAEQLDAEGRRKLQVIRNNTRNMGRLIDELLEFSRLGRKELNLGRLDMTALAQAAFDDAANAAANSAGGAGEHSTSLSLEALPDAHGDIVLLKQVWFNLLSNAFKFSAKREQAHISISAVTAEGLVTYTVRDNGAGFDMRYYNKMFGVFQRLHRVSEFEGTGVGLAIVQRIVNRHGGRVWAEGVVGEGAVFHFVLPLHIPLQQRPEAGSNRHESV